MAFKIEIRDINSRNTLTFGPRTPGQVGKDILAIKIALGLIKRLDPNDPEHGVYYNDEDFSTGAEVPMDKQLWFNCQTGLGTDLKTASTFDLDMQNVLKKFQIDNHFLITSYFFHKRGIREILAEMPTGDPGSEEFKRIVIRQVDLLIPLYDIEFGQLGEATLAVLHGWRPHTTLHNDGFVHPKSIYPELTKPVVDIVPEDVFTDAAGSARGNRNSFFANLLKQGYVHSNLADPLQIWAENPAGELSLAGVSYGYDREDKLKEFKKSSPGTNDWIKADDGILSVPFKFMWIDYKPAWENTSLIKEPALLVMSNTEDFTDPTLIDSKTKEKRIKAFFYPDPFSSTSPFLIDTDKLGFFYETEYEISSGKTPDKSQETIARLEDEALEEVIKFYKKPKIWNFLINESQFNSTYLAGNHSNLQPEHSGVFPIEVDKERIQNSSAYKTIEFKIKLLEQRIKRLNEKLIPSAANRHMDMGALEVEVRTKIAAANSEINNLKTQKERILSGETIKKKDFWVLSTETFKNNLSDPQSVQSWRVVESDPVSTGIEPLIKFIEFRTPPMRPGMKYRALMEINKEKLDLIIYGDTPPELRPEELNDAEQGTPSPDDLVKVCPSKNVEEAKRTYQEMVSHAKKRRRELARTLKEITSQQDTQTSSPQIDLGVFGPYDFNKAFSSLHGLSGITNEYEYTKKALKLLSEGSGALLESWGISDTAAEDLQQAINDGTAKSEFGDKDARKYNQIKMSWSELKERIKTASKDLSEAAKIIETENIRFIRGSNYKPESEAQLLSSITSQLDEMIGDSKFTVASVYGDNRTTLSQLVDKYKEDEIIISIQFEPIGYTGLGPKNGKKITNISVGVQKKDWFDFDSGIPKLIFTVLPNGNTENSKALKEYESLSRPRTVNYLSYIGAMTNPYPSSFGGFIKSFWDDGRSVCSELGINSDKGLALSLVGNYTSGIQIDFSQDEEGLIDAFKDWSKKNFVNPTKKWLQQSAANARASVEDTFDEAAALEAFGKLCTLEQLYKEFFDKLDLKSLLCDFLKCLKLPAFEFKMPSFYLPPWPKIPIIGWYGYMIYFLVKKIKEILTRILCTFARTIIDKLSIPFCQEQLEDFVSAGSSATPVMNKALAEALTNTGITSGNEQKAKEFFDDVANLTTGQELCRLLQGLPLDAAAMQMLRRLAERQGIGMDLDTDEAIINYFGVIGAFVPFDVCDQLASLPNADSINAGGPIEDCDQMLRLLTTIRNRLLTGDPNVTDEEIKEVLDLAKKNLNDRKAEMEALSGANFDALLPPNFRPGTKENQATIINSMPSFLSKVMQDSAENLFMPSKSSYISGLSTYVSSMKIQSPNNPTAFDEDYDSDTNLRLEAALEQIKNYTQLMDSGSEPISASEMADALADSGNLFKDAYENGLGRWSNRGNHVNELLFLNTTDRDLDDPEIRQENQQMIQALFEKEVLRTLKVKQIISAFTIFENFGHDPLAAVMKYSRELKRSLEVRINSDQKDHSGGITREKLRQYQLSNWWRVRPKGVSQGATLEDAYQFVDDQIILGLNQDDEWCRVGAENAIRTFTLVTHTLQEMPWYKAWAGITHPNYDPELIPAMEEFERIFYSGDLQEETVSANEDRTKRRGYISNFFRQLDGLHPFADLEIFCSDNVTQNTIHSINLDPEIQRDRAGHSGLATQKIRRHSLDFFVPAGPDGPNAAHHGAYDAWLGMFLHNISSGFFPTQTPEMTRSPEPADMSACYGGTTGWRTVRNRDLEHIGSGATVEIHQHLGHFGRINYDDGMPYGNPLFLVNDVKGREFLPIVGFGNGIMTNISEFETAAREKKNKGYDIFLPLERPQDFLLCNPETVHSRTVSFDYRVDPNHAHDWQYRDRLRYAKRYSSDFHMWSGNADDGHDQNIDAFMRGEENFPAVNDYQDAGPTGEYWDEAMSNGGELQHSQLNALSRAFYPDVESSIQDRTFRTHKTATMILPRNSNIVLTWREYINQMEKVVEAFQEDADNGVRNAQHAADTMQPNLQRMRDRPFVPVVGHPFHQRIGYGFEDITTLETHVLAGAAGEPYGSVSGAGMTFQDPSLESFHFNPRSSAGVDDAWPQANNLLDWPTSPSQIFGFKIGENMYNSSVYGGHHLSLSSNLYDWHHVHLRQKPAGNRAGVIGNWWRTFLFARSEYSMINRASFVYRQKGKATNAGQDWLADEMSRIPLNSWDPLQLRPNGAGAGIHDRDHDLLHYMGANQHTEENPQAWWWKFDREFLDPKRMLNDNLNQAQFRPMISAKVFFMLPNRVMENLQNHLMAAGKDKITIESMDGGDTEMSGFSQWSQPLAGLYNLTQMPIHITDGDTNINNWHNDHNRRGKLAARASDMQFFDDRRALMNNQLYMKIVKLLCTKKIVHGQDGSGALPFVDNFVLKNFAMSVIKKRMEILESAMRIYGTRNTGTFHSILSNVESQAPFTGFSNPADISITPKEVKVLFTPFETERVWHSGQGWNVVHKRFYKDPSTGSETYIQYRDFIDLIQDPLGEKWPRSADGKKVDFYLRPFKLNNQSREELSFETRDLKMSYETNTGDRVPISRIIPKTALGEEFEKEYISKDQLYLNTRIDQLSEKEKNIARDSFIRTTRMLLLDEDKDHLIELAQLTTANTTGQIKLAYTNSGALLEIASERIEKLTAMILEILQNTKQNLSFHLLPTISSILQKIKYSSPSVGDKMNLIYLGGPHNAPGARYAPHNIGLRFGPVTSPYTPGIKMVELPTTGRPNNDRFNIVVDSDINLGLGFKKDLSQYSSSPDRDNPESLVRETDASQKYRKIFSFCDELPDSLISNMEINTSTIKYEPRRFIFGKLVEDKLVRAGMLTSPDGGAPTEQQMAAFRDTIEKEVFDEVVSNLLGEMTNSIEKSPLFDDLVADEIETRVSGKPVVTETTNGRCVSNRYSLDSASILSFKKVIIGDVFEEVLAEMSKPESSPFNRDFGKPEPFDKAMQTVSVKAFIRLCLVDLMLKGGLAYSVWDMEPIIPSPVFREYVKTHVIKELEKNKNLRSVWGKTLERSEGISNKMKALESVISEELLKFPQYSKQIFHPNENKDFYNWFAYGQTLFPGESTESLEGENKFFTKEGVIPRLPVPNHNRDDRIRIPFFGKTHLGNFAKWREGRSRYKTVASSYRRFSKLERVDTKPIIDAPTSKLIYEDYYRVSGEILDYFGAEGTPPKPANTERDESFVLSYEEMEGVFITLRSEVDGPQEISDVLKSSVIKIGKRLSLLLSKAEPRAGGNIDNSLAEDNPEYNSSGISKLVERVHDDFQSTKAKLSVRERAYRIFPAPELCHNPLFWDHPVLVSIPLAHHEKELSIEDCDLIMGLFNSQPLSPRNQSTVPSEFYLHLSQKLLESEECRHYLENLFPIRRYMAVSTIFSTSVLGGFNDVPGILSSAKIMVSFVGMICSLSPEKRQDLISMDQADWAKMMREKSPGDMNDAECFEFPDITSEFFEAFFKELLKILKYFPSILFRGIANILDPAYKEMRNHYMNCDIRNLSWNGIAWYSTLKSSDTSPNGRNRLVNGLSPGTGNGPEPNGKYAPIIPAAPVDFGIGVAEIFKWNFAPLLQATLKTVAYAYAGGLPFVDLSNSFKVPCAEIDESLEMDGKYDAGAFGRYGQPLSPFTILALSTLQLPADIDKRKSACVVINSEGEEPEQLIPDEDCDEEFEE